MFLDGVKKTISSFSVTHGASNEDQLSTRSSTTTNQQQHRPDTAPNPQADREVYPSRHWFPSLPFQQFQVLFNSLFKVLCIFPSRYLYAIGLPPIFSFRWNLPPTWSCNPKQLDSNMNAQKHSQTGVSPSTLPCSKGLWPHQ